MADKKAIDKDYLLTQLQNYTSEVIAKHFVQSQKNYSLISNTDLAQITTNQLAIADLEASTSKAAIQALIAAEIAKVVANADTSYDTLKEIADWITSHEGSAASMNTQLSSLKDNKADNMKYDDETGTLSLLAGDRVIKSVAVSGGGSGGGHYLTYPEFTMNFTTGHISAEGGTGVEFVINAEGHLESEVL